MKMHIRVPVILAILLLLLSPLGATFNPPELVPIDRLLRSAKTAVEKEPKSAEAHYTLGRVHYLAFSYATGEVPALVDKETTGVPPFWIADAPLMDLLFDEANKRARSELGLGEAQIPVAKREEYRAAATRHAEALQKSHWRPPPNLAVSARSGHAKAALQEFRAAIRLDAKNGLYLLGLASLLEEVALWLKREPAAEVPSELRRIRLEDALTTYLRAYRLAIETEMKMPMPIAGARAFVGYEAGGAFLRLTAESDTPRSTNSAAEVQEVQHGLKQLTAKPVGAITPIILGLNGATRIGELLAPECTVTFNLRGFGGAETWPWVRSHTGMLVWDPAKRGEITSGVQLFGGYTFQIFRANGYEALAALDDDGDGFLRGAELDGIRVWFDRNVDGRADAGEVRDLAELGIVGLAARFTAMEGRHPTHPEGVVLIDGRTAPSWDWMVEPIGR